MFIPFTVLAASPGPAPTIWVGFALPFFFVSMWLTVSFIISRMGWVRFARAYACPKRPSGTSFPVPFVSFGSSAARYNGAVSAIASDAGLHLRAVLIFSAFHTPFLLPWSSVTRIDRIDGWFIKGYHLHIQDQVGSIQIRFRRSFESELRRYIPSLMDAPVPSTFPSLNREPMSLMKKAFLTTLLTLAALARSYASEEAPFESVKLTAAPAINWELRNNETVDAQKIGGPISIKLESCKGIVVTACDLNSIELIGCTDITIRNCWIHDSERIAVQIGGCTNVVVEGCRMENVVSGVFACGGHGIRVLGNFVHNVKGPFPRGQAAQFDEVTGADNAICDNYVINERGKSFPEDCINLYKSTGTAESPILVENNYLTGDPVAGSQDKSPNGSGIMLGDEGGAHILCRKNTILSAGQMGIGVAGGHFIRVEDNYILGLKSNVTSQGMYVWNQSKQPCDHITLARNRVHWVNKEGEEFSFWNGGGATDLTETDNHFSDATLLSEAQPLPPSKAPQPPKPWVSVSADGTKKVRVAWQMP